MAVRFEIVQPKSRVRSRDDDAEAYLRTWAEWCMAKRMAQGFGGGVDLEAGRMPRAPGTHGDPVLAEFLATEADGQGRDQIVDDVIRRYPRDWRKVAWARWVGRQEPTGWMRADQKDSVEVAEGVSFPMKVRAQQATTWKWSGPQAWPVVATQTGIPLRTCERIAAQIKRLIVIDVDVAMAHVPAYRR